MSLLPYGKKSFEDWIQFFESTLLSIGSALLLSGIFFLVAFNWNHLDRFTKLGIVGLLNLIAYWFTIFFRKNPLYFEIGLTTIFFLTASALFTFGQIYQTGADVYDLFVGWAGLTFLLTLVSRGGVVAGLWMVLLTFTIFLYTEQVSTGGVNHIVFTVASLLFGGFVLSFDWVKTNPYSDRTKVFLSGLGLTIALCFLNLASFSLFRNYEVIYSDFTSVFFKILLPLTFYVFFYYFYRWVVFRLINLTIILLFGLGQTFLKTMDLFQIWAYSAGVSFLLFALLITGYTVLAVSHLHHLRNAKLNKGDSK